ncbi:encapsulin [Sorangium sp. So ce363]|uniref:encapsulin n=1 Tax=Sorangium sp. So ce363 TaxID=3133304 RepID=UPI003F64322F
MLKLHLAGRKLVDVRRPFGWEFAAVNTGRVPPDRRRADRVGARARRRRAPEHAG